MFQNYPVGRLCHFCWRVSTLASDACLNVLQWLGSSALQDKLTLCYSGLQQGLSTKQQGKTLNGISWGRLFSKLTCCTAPILLQSVKLLLCVALFLCTNALNVWLCMSYIWVRHCLVAGKQLGLPARQVVCSSRWVCSSDCRRSCRGDFWEILFLVASLFCLSAPFWYLLLNTSQLVARFPMNSQNPRKFTMLDCFYLKMPRLECERLGSSIDGGCVLNFKMFCLQAWCLLSLTKIVNSFLHLAIVLVLAIVHLMFRFLHSHITNHLRLSSRDFCNKKLIQNAENVVFVMWIWTISKRFARCLFDVDVAMISGPNFVPEGQKRTQKWKNYTSGLGWYELFWQNPISRIVWVKLCLQRKRFMHGTKNIRNRLK